jgi:predicted RNA-binding protein with PUA domain
VIAMTEYLLAIHRDYAVPLPPEVTRKKWSKLTAVAQERPAEVRPCFDGDLDDPILASVGQAEAEAFWRDPSEAR